MKKMKIQSSISELVSAEGNMGPMAPVGGASATSSTLNLTAASSVIEEGVQWDSSNPTLLVRPVIRSLYEMNAIAAGNSLKLGANISLTSADYDRSRPAFCWLHDQLNDIAAGNSLLLGASNLFKCADYDRAFKSSGNSGPWCNNAAALVDFQECNFTIELRSMRAESVDNLNGFLPPSNSHEGARLWLFYLKTRSSTSVLWNVSEEKQSLWLRWIHHFYFNNVFTLISSFDKIEGRLDIFYWMEGGSKNPSQQLEERDHHSRLQAEVLVVRVSGVGLLGGFKS